MERIEKLVLMGHRFLDPYNWIDTPFLAVVPYLALISKLLSPT